MKSNLVITVAVLALLAGCATPSPQPGISATSPPVKLIAQAWKASWSPDGQRIVYGKGRNGLEIRNLRTGQTNVLSATGKDPVWSPDGRWIAFVREPQRDEYLQESVWLVKPDGTSPRRIAAGGFPSWSVDGRKLFVHSRQKNQILACNPKDASATPEVFYEGTPAWYFSVSPGGDRVAFGTSGRLEIRSRSTGELLLSSPTPGERGLLPAWSPDGRLVAFGGFDDSAGGLRLLDVQTGRTVTLIAGQYTMPVWNSNGRWLAFDERTRGANGIWIVGRAHVDNLFRESAAASPSALPGGQAQAEQVLRQMTDFYRDLKSFSFELRTEFSGTIAQDYEETMSLVSTYAVKVQRPGRVSMKLMAGRNILLGGFVTDGTNTYHKGLGQEIVRPLPQRDDGERFLEGPYGFLAAKNPYHALRGHLATLQYLGMATLDGQPCHRLGSREAEGYRWEHWVRAGAQPLLKQVILLVPESERQPKGEPPHIFEDLSKTTWRFADWNMNPTFADDAFAIPTKNQTPIPGPIP